MTNHVRTIAILSSILLALPAFAQEIEKPRGRDAVVVSDDSHASADLKIRKAPRTINVGGNGNVTLVEHDPKANAAPKTWLGLVLDELSPAVASHLPLDPDTGLIVEHVTPESPAAKAGLQKHDILVRLGDQLLIAPKQFQTLVSNHKDGDVVEITFLRKGQQQTVKATLATYHPSYGLADHESTINLHGTKIDVEQLLENLHDTAGSIILNKKTVFVGPDGNPVTIDGNEIRDKTVKMLEQSGLTGEIIEQVKRAISEAHDQIKKAQDQAKNAAEQARNAAQQAQVAADRATQDARRNAPKAPSTELGR